jgi:SAM-dependent methyltransferase
MPNIDGKKAQRLLDETRPLALKQRVQDFWERSSCGEVHAVGTCEEAKYEVQSRARYDLEPYLVPFARFHDGAGKDVLEIGVGMGADHVQWALTKPRSLTGLDLTDRAIEHVRRRFAICGLSSNLVRGDAEDLPFHDSSFDLVYSWGVIHHTPNTPKAVHEIHRVLRPGGTARIMIYHTYSLVGYMLWCRYGLFVGRPFQGLKDIYHHHLESPGTKAYSVQEARSLFAGFSNVDVRVQLSFGDLLQGEVGQRHKSFMLAVAKRLLPRFLLRRLFGQHGLYLFVEALK